MIFPLAVLHHLESISLISKNHAWEGMFSWTILCWRRVCYFGPKIVQKIKRWTTIIYNHIILIKLYRLYQNKKFCQWQLYNISEVLTDKTNLNSKSTTGLSLPPLNYRIMFCEWFYHVPRHWLSDITWYYIGSPCIPIGTADSVPFWGRVVVICLGCVPRQIVKSETQFWLKQNETVVTPEGIPAVGRWIKRCKRGDEKRHLVELKNPASFRDIRFIHAFNIFRIIIRNHF